MADAIPARELTEAEKAKGYTHVQYVTPGKRSKKGVIRDYRFIDPKTGKEVGQIDRIEYQRQQLGQRKFKGTLFVRVPPPEELAQQLRAREERLETKALAQKEAEFEAKRIKEGKIKAKDVVLTQKGAKEILQRILKERAEKEAEEKRKFPTKEERIRETLRKQRVLETLKKQAKVAREQQIKEQIAKRKRVKEIEGPKVFLDPETARKVREQLAEKGIQKTVLKAEFPDLRSFFPPKKRFAVIGAEQPIPSTGLITTETGLIKFFQAKKRREAKTKLEEFEVILETPSKIGVSFEKEGKVLAGASLIFIGKTAETAFGISPPGIAISIKRRGLLETAEQFTGIPLIRAIKEERLLKATTPIGRLAEATGITTGVIIGARVTKVSVRGVKKGIQVLQKESARLRAPEWEPQVRAEKLKGFEPIGKGQQRFVKVTETGKEIPQFQEEFISKEGLIDIKRVVATRKQIKVFDPVTAKLKGDVKFLKGKGEAQVKFDIPKQKIPKIDIDLITGKEPKISRIIEPTKKVEVPPKGKQIKITKDVGEGFLDRELFDIEFEVPTTPTARRLTGVFRGKKAQVILEPPALETKVISAFDREVSLTTGAPAVSGLFLLPPIVEEEEKAKLELGLDIDVGRRLRREQEKELLLSPALKKLSAEELGQILRQPTITKPKVGVDIDLIKERITERKREKELILIPDIGVALEPTLEQDLKLDVPKPPPPKPPPPKQIVLPPPLPKERFKEPEEEELFFAKAKSKGKFVTLNKKALPRNKALNLGAEVVDNTASATFKLVSAREKGKDVSDDLGFNLRGKFTKKNSTYVEKNKHRIDSMGEIQGITVKGWLAQRRKGLRI